MLNNMDSNNLRADQFQIALGWKPSYNVKKVFTLKSTGGGGRGGGVFPSPSKFFLIFEVVNLYTRNS